MVNGDRLFHTAVFFLTEPL